MHAWAVCTMEMDFWYWLAAQEIVPEAHPAAELLRGAEQLDARVRHEERGTVRRVADRRERHSPGQITGPRVRNEETPAA